MTKQLCAAVADGIIWATGETEDAAYEAAERDGVQRVECRWMTPQVSAEIERHGFDGARDSYDMTGAIITGLVRNGQRVVPND